MQRGCHRAAQWTLEPSVCVPSKNTRTVYVEFHRQLQPHVASGLSLLGSTLIERGTLMHFVLENSYMSESHTCKLNRIGRADARPSCHIYFSCPWYTEDTSLKINTNLSRLFHLAFKFDSRVYRNFRQENLSGRSVSRLQEDVARTKADDSRALGLTRGFRLCVTFR